VTTKVAVEVAVSAKPDSPGGLVPGAGSMRRSVRLLVPVSCDSCLSYTPGLSTRCSSGSLQTLRSRRPHLAGGFTLRCLQRLSGPYLATQRCPERDNWHTSGTSLPILSY